MTTHRIRISDGGRLQFVYDDVLHTALSDTGRAEVRRASDVEWWANGWQADLEPVGGPVLGPFETRQAALDAERAWLAEHMGL